MKILRELELSGCYEIELFRHTDERGVFVKPWSIRDFEKVEFNFKAREIFWSTSKRGSIRGMHFQSPPHAHQKIVSCQQGSVCDVLLDLRGNSPTYGQAASLELSEQRGNAAYIPIGIAHGFQGLTAKSQVLYITSYEHHPESDLGIHHESFSFEWPLKSFRFLKETKNTHPYLSSTLHSRL